MTARAVEQPTSSALYAHVLKLLFSRLVGQRESRSIAHVICLLLGALYEVSGPFYGGSEHDSVNGRISARWQRATAKTGDGLLDDEILEKYFPPRIHEAFLDVIAAGPAEFVSEVSTFLTQAATGKDEEGDALLDEETGEPVETASAAFVENRLRAARKLVDEIIELRKLSERFRLGECLDHWRRDDVPKWPTTKRIGAQAKRLDRSAPPLAYVRACLRDQTREIDKRLKRTGRRRHEKTFGLMRARLLVALCALGLRKGTVRRILMEDFLPAFELMPGLHVPALRLSHLKTVDEGERIFPIPPTLASWIQQYLEYVVERGHQPNPKQPLILPKMQRRWAGHTRTTGCMIYHGVVRALAPYSNGRLYSPHTLRHLAEQYAVRAGADWLELHTHDKDTLPRPSGVGVPIAAQTFADCLNDHTLQDMADRYGDRDNEAARRWWRRIAAEGVWDYYWGDRGAPKGLDVVAVYAARERLQELTAEQAKRLAKIDALERDRNRLEQQKFEERAAAVRDADSLDEIARFRVQMHLDGFNDRITALGREIELELRKLPEIGAAITHAQEDVRIASTTLVAIPDDAQPVLTIEPTEFEACIEDEQTAALEEAPIVRREFDLAEFHRALGGTTVISVEQLRRYVRGVSAWKTLFDDDGNGRPKGVSRPTPHKCLISFDALPLHRYPVEVVERLDALRHEPPRSLTKAA